MKSFITLGPGYVLEKEITYGGCGGNKNNFGTREECERFCNRDGMYLGISFHKL